MEVEREREGGGGEKMHMSHFAILFVSANQPESMSFHNELSSSIPSVLLSHPLNVEYILSWSKGVRVPLYLSPSLSISLPCQIIDNCVFPPAFCLPSFSLSVTTPKTCYSPPSPHPPTQPPHPLHPHLTSPRLASRDQDDGGNGRV